MIVSLNFKSLTDSRKYIHLTFLVSPNAMTWIKILKHYQASDRVAPSPISKVPDTQLSTAWVRHPAAVPCVQLCLKCHLYAGNEMN